MLKKNIILTIFLVYAFVGMAQGNESLTLSTYSKEAFTGEPVKTATAVILNKETNDTLAKGQKNFYAEIKDNFQILVTRLSFQVPKIPAEYILVAAAPEYDTIYQAIKIDKIGNREFEKSLPDLVFYKTATYLNELSVTATKVKFYNNGDTIVYNADAFALPNGSMLDALIKQLPGVELMPGGEIYVNGRKVESLLLNGKNFFQGDRNLMLNNLGAYTVKTVEVYDKMSEMSEMMGTNQGDSQYVMDVKLKKEYLSGFIGNLEAGYGTENRYLGRLFGLWYTTKSRLGIIGNFNNLNDQRTPGERSSWSASQLPGDLLTKMAGLDYLINPEDNKGWEFSGNTTFSHVRNTDITSVYQTNFLSQGDNYQNNYSQGVTRNLDIKTKNSLRISFPKLHLGNTISQNLKYSENKGHTHNISGLFQENIKEMTESLLEKIYAGEITSFKDVTINSSLQQFLSSSKTFEAGGGIRSGYSIPHTPDYISIDVDGNYRNVKYYGFNFYDVNYNLLDTRHPTYQYIDNHPDRTWNISLNPGYFYQISPQASLYFSGGWEHSSTVKDSYLYDLDRLSDSGVFGILPSDYLSTLNNGQTFLSSENSDRGTIGVNYNATYNMGEGKLHFQIIPSLSFRWRKFRYKQGDYDTPIKTYSSDLQFAYSYISYSIGKHDLKLLYMRIADLTPLNRMVDIADNRNPLNIFLGNPDLKNSMKNELTFTWEMSKNGQHSWRNTANIKYTLIENAFTNGYSFNSETGVRIYKMYNVNGNYWLSAWNFIYKRFGSKDQFDISSNTGLYYVKASDVTALDNMDFQTFAVNNLTLSETLRLGWVIGKQNIGLNGTISWRNTNSANNNFADFTSITAQYGLTLKLNLPYNFSLSTDYNFYTRSGFSETSLNRTDMVWNARLSYSLKGGKWLFMLDCFDLLHQLTNVTYNVNAVGRTETSRNTLPRYVLLHIQYRFDVKPKKKA